MAHNEQYMRISYYYYCQILPANHYIVCLTNYSHARQPSTAPQLLHNKGQIKAGLLPHTPRVTSCHCYQISPSEARSASPPPDHQEEMPPHPAIFLPKAGEIFKAYYTFDLTHHFFPWLSPLGPIYSMNSLHKAVLVTDGWVCMSYN